MRLLIACVLLCSSLNVLASPLKLNYSLFFGYMKTMYKLDYQDVTTAFYLVDKSTGLACEIETAEIVVDNKREVIIFQKEGRLLPFFSDQHRKDGAVIEVQTANNQQCNLQVTLMAKESELKALSTTKLAQISVQLEGVLRKNAGMIGKYFLPEYQGLRLKLALPLTALQIESLPKEWQLATNGDLLIANSLLTASEPTDLFNYSVSRVTPWIGK